MISVATQHKVCGQARRVGEVRLVVIAVQQSLRKPNRRRNQEQFALISRTIFFI